MPSISTYQGPQPWEQRQFNDRLNTCRSGHFVLGSGMLATAFLGGLAAKAHAQKRPLPRNLLGAAALAPMALAGISLIPSNLFKSDLQQYQQKYGSQRSQDQHSSRPSTGWVLPGLAGSVALGVALTTFPRRWQPAGQALQRPALGKVSILHHDGAKLIQQLRPFSAAPWLLTAGASVYLLNEARKALWQDTRKVCLSGK